MGFSYKYKFIMKNYCYNNQYLRIARKAHKSFVESLIPVGSLYMQLS